MFRNMEYVYAVYKEMSFSRAAEKLFISQPALSAMVKKVEKRIGSPIFDRSCSPIRLTNCGKEYISCIEQIMDVEYQFSQYLNQTEHLLIGSLSIGANSIFASFLLPSCMTAFARFYPGIHVSMTEANTDILLDALNAGRNLRGQLTCFLASTGVGKSHIAKWIGVRADIDDGLHVLHFQLEGSEEEALNAYSGGLISRNAYYYERGKISDTEMRHLEKLVASYAGSITVRSYPRFNAQVSTLDIKNGISEYRKLKGYNPDIVIVDSMDLLTDANRRSWGADHERAKRIAVANDLKDLAADEKVWMVVTYQSTIEDREWLNDERNVLTEYNCSEAIGLARPCTHLVSLNQSSAERKENVMRLHVAKSRFFKKGDTIRIATDYDNEVFYDGQRTLNLNRE